MSVRLCVVTLVALLLGAGRALNAATPPSSATADAVPPPSNEPATELRVLDDFADPTAWTLTATDDVKATLRTSSAAPALCLHIDFGRVTGYVALRRDLPIDLPPRYEFLLSVRSAPLPLPPAGEGRGEGTGPRTPPTNELQFKLDDGSGNVWWGRRLDFRAPPAPGLLRFRQRQIEFAWGPTPDRTLRHAARVELVIASGRDGGMTSVCFDQLALRRLPDIAPPVPAPHLSADRLGVDFGVPREFGALALAWDAAGAPSDYAIEFSDDALAWRRVLRVDRARGPSTLHFLADAETRHVRIVPLAPTSPEGADPTAASTLAAGAAGAAAGATSVAPPGRPALRSIEPLEMPNIDAAFRRLASAAPRGRYPRAYLGEQPYWTVFGVDRAPVAALLGEDGAVEPRPGIGALEPFVVEDGRVLGWADATTTHTLRDDALPMPAVHWRLGELALDIAAFGAGTPAAAQALVRYTLRNLGPRTRTLDLVLAWRPFQVNPPTQFLANPGGAAEVTALAWDGRALRADGVPRVWPLVAPARVQIEPLAAGPVGDWVADPTRPAAAPRFSAVGDALAYTCGPVDKSPVRAVGEPAACATPAGVVPPGARAQGPVDEAGGAARANAIERVDPERHASAALHFPLTLGPGATREIAVALPIVGAPEPPSGLDAVARAAERVAAAWHERLDRVRLRGGPEVTELDRNLRAALAQILVNRAGPALQPGARAYARSWIRDGALTSSALLRLGHAEEVRDFITWYAQFQFANGKVPCCATARGADPVPENDSDGEFAFTVAELLRYTGDLSTARALWPKVRAALAHMERLRQSERNAQNHGAERGAYFGLLPPSISHEGYSDKPAYAYWDDFWAAIGDRSGAELAEALGEPADAARLRDEGTRFKADLLRSIDASTHRHGLGVLPGSADRGDVDPTSSTIALSPGGLGAVLPPALVAATFDRYWRDFQGRRADEAAGVRHGDGAYTPYEWRNVGALVRLDERARALQAVAYFDRDRRPAGWRQWAEVVARDPREPRFLGDMPHGWVASDQIRAVLDLFAYEDEGRHALVLAAGVPLDWLAGHGVAIDGLRTPWGQLGWRARMLRRGTRHVAVVEWHGLDAEPPGGIRLRGPWPAGAAVRIGHRRGSAGPEGIALTRRPARVRLIWHSTTN